MPFRGPERKQQIESLRADSLIMWNLGNMQVFPAGFAPTRRPREAES